MQHKLFDDPICIHECSARTQDHSDDTDADLSGTQCRICFGHGHWGNECPQNAIQVQAVKDAGWNERRWTSLKEDWSKQESPAPKEMTSLQHMSKSFRKPEKDSEQPEAESRAGGSSKDAPAGLGAAAGAAE